MRKHIENLQKKPYHIRKALFYLATGLSMALVLGLWVHSLGNQWEEDFQAEKLEKDFRPFSLFSKSISNTYNSTREAVGDFGGGLNATVGGTIPEEAKTTSEADASAEVPEI